MSDQKQQDGGGGLITNPQDLGHRIVHWQQQGFHVLSPAIKITAIAPGYGINASLVVLDPRTEEEGGRGDVYHDRNQMDDDERAPSKLGLLKIASLMGINWVDPYGRVDPLTIQNLWIYRVTGVYLAYDGTVQVIKGEKEIDYRDGSAQIGGWSGGNEKVNGWGPQRVMQARCNGAERAETGALERAIRTLGVKHTYKVDELAKPFVALRLSPVVDTTDPAVRRDLAARASMSAASLYAGQHLQPQRALTNGAPEVLEVQLQPVREVREEPVARRQPERRQEAPKAQERQAPEGDDEPHVDPRLESEAAQPKLPDGAVRIRKVAKEQKPYGKNHQKAGQNFTLWRVWFEGSDQEYTTTYATKWGKVIDACYNADNPAAGKPVVFTAAPQANQFGETEILNIKEAVPVVTPAMAGSFKL